MNFDIFNCFTIKQLHLIASQCNIDYYIYYPNLITNKFDHLFDTKPIIINKLIYFFNNNFSIPKPFYINNCHSNPYVNTKVYSLDTNICIQNFSFNNHNLIFFLDSINLKPTIHLWNIVVDKWINTSIPFNFKKLLLFYISYPLPSHTTYNINDTLNSCKYIYKFLYIPFIKSFIVNNI